MFLSPEVHVPLKCMTVCDKCVSETQVRVGESTQPEEDTHRGRGFKKASWRRYRIRRVSINQVGQKRRQETKTHIHTNTHTHKL